MANIFFWIENILIHNNLDDIHLWIYLVSAAICFLKKERKKKQTIDFGGSNAICKIYGLYSRELDNSVENSTNDVEEDKTLRIEEIKRSQPTFC